MKKTEFAERLIRFTPLASQAAEIWEEWAEELSEYDSHGSSGKLPGEFLEEFCSKIELVGQLYGNAAAGKVVELSLHKSCVFPWEIVRAGELFSKEADFIEVFNASVEGLLDSPDLDIDAEPSM